MSASPNEPTRRRPFVRPALGADTPDQVADDQWDGGWVVEGVIRGDEQAYTAMYEQFYPRLVAWGRSRLKQHEEAEDLAQASLAKVWKLRSDPRVPRAPGAFAGWVMEITKNTLFHVWRSRRRRKTERLSADVACPESQDDDRWEEFWAAFLQLPPEDRQILRLFYLEERRAKEIGALLGISEGAVWVRLSRVRASVRRSL